MTTSLRPVDPAPAALAPLARAYAAGQPAFLLSGAVLDPIEIRGRVGPLARVLAQGLGEDFDPVLALDLALGLRVVRGELSLGDAAREPLSAPAALLMVHDLLRAERRRRIAVVIDRVEDLVPAGALGPAERACGQLLEHLAADPAVARAGHLVLALVHDAERLGVALGRGSSAWLRHEVPPAGVERRRALVHERQARADGPVLEGVTIDEVAQASASLPVAELGRRLGAVGVVDRQALIGWRREEIVATSGGLLTPVEPFPGGFDAVAGLAGPKRALRAAIGVDGALVARQVGAILLAGPPGTGKSLLAQALAADPVALVLRLGAVRSRWFGGTEENAERVFSVLRRLGPALVLVDEADLALGNRDAGQEMHEAEQHLLARLLEGMQASRNERSALWLIATNQPGRLDPAVRSRVSRAFPVLLPGPRARAETLATIARAMRVESDAIDWSRVSALVPNASGRELLGLVERGVDDGATGALTQAALERCARLWLGPKQTPERLTEMSLEALAATSFRDDLPPLDDLPEHLVGRLGPFQEVPR